MKPLRPLSEREQAVLRLLLQGMSNPEIARELSLSDQSVREHMAALLWKYGLPKRRHTLVARLLGGRRAAPEGGERGEGNGEEAGGAPAPCPQCERRNEWLRAERQKEARRTGQRAWRHVLAPRAPEPPAFSPPPTQAARWREILALERRAGELREQLQAEIAWDWTLRERAAEREKARAASRTEARPALAAGVTSVIVGA